MRILIINGPNLNLLGTREPDIYGTVTMDDFLTHLRQSYKQHELLYYQSNSEGEIIDRLQKNDYDAVVINPGAYSHYSHAISDSLKNIALKKIEVHISNIYKREDFRQKSVTASNCEAVLSGFGLMGYELAIQSLVQESI